MAGEDTGRKRPINYPAETARIQMELAANSTIADICKAIDLCDDRHRDACLLYTSPSPRD